MAEDAGQLRSGGLVTVAFLKAQVDSGSDQLGMFMPLMLDVLPKITSDNFAAGDVQAAIESEHGISVPLHALTTLLKRVVTKGLLKRESGRYWKTGKPAVGAGAVAGQKTAIEAEQAQLARELMRHAERRQLHLDSEEAALEILTSFIEDEHVSLLLRTPSRRVPRADDLSRAVVAEFVRSVVADDVALSTALSRMLEGLVLYHAVFQPDINPAAKTFKDLTVVFDSNLIRQALGYEGVAAQALMSETLDVLKAAGVSCQVFDKTVDEIRRILAMYEARLGTAAGRQSLHAVPMARHFLTKRYAPSDVREMAALLERDIAAAGFRMHRLPSRVPEFTAKESALAQRLARPGTPADDQEPRVVHDVDCVAGVLVMRRGHRSHSIENAGAVFATSSSLVIQNTRLWWIEDEREAGIEPIVHIRALTNIAWLKRPKLAQNFKLRELIALCGAAMRPGQAIWDRFLRHLKSLQESNRITSDEATAIVVSSLSDELLRNAELEDDEGRDIDATTLDEIVDRVRATYSADSQRQTAALQEQYARQLAEMSHKVQEATARAEQAERAAAESSRQERLRVEKVAHRWAKVVRWAIQITVVAGVLGGGAALALGHHTPAGPVGKLVLLAVLVFVLLEVFGILKHVSEGGVWLEAKLASTLRDFLSRKKQP